MYHLKKVTIVSGNMEEMNGSGDLRLSLEREGIGLLSMTPKEFESFWETAAAADTAPEGSALEDAVLWITDIPRFGRKLLEGGEAVLAFLRSGGEDGDFAGVLFACEDLEGTDAEYMEKVYRRYRNIPWDILRTERCSLRETVEDDVEAFWRIYSDPKITRYTEGLYPEKEKERQYISDYRKAVYAFYNFGVWTVLSRETGEIIGRAGLSMREGFEDPELGFVIAAAWQRRGIAYEICSAILEYGRDELGFERVQAFVEPANEASRKLCAKLGMAEAGDVDICGTRHIREVIHF